MSRGDLLDPARALATRRDTEDDRRPAFVEGIFLGAMVGAAIAGSTLWNRIRAGRASDAHRGADAAAAADDDDRVDPSGA